MPESGAESDKDVKFPKRIKFRGRPLATIYRPSKSYPNYRVAWTAGGRRMMKAFHRYGDAKGRADELVKQLAKGSQVPSLTAGQAGDAVAALECLQRFYVDTGKRTSLLGAVSEYCEAGRKLAGRSLGEAVDGFLSNAAVVARKDLGDAVAEFIAGRKHLAESKDGKRSKHSPDYEYHVAFWLNEFAGAFPGHAVCDLTKEHLNGYIGSFKGLSVKTRNDRRAAVKMFLRWSAAKDYLPQSHRLFEAVDFKPEDKDPKVIDYYRPRELRAMLEAAAPDVLPVITLSGLAGIRIEECLRLDWADVWRVQDKVEISARIAKGRQRRLVTICPALAAWLEPFRQSSGPVCDKTPMGFNRAFVKLRESLDIPARRNGLRHGFVTFHMALHSNETWTAAEAGHTPEMLHEHYRALETKSEAEKWFAVAPARPANVLALQTADATPRMANL
ncbi:MAG: tyrosine-type recombinase/integrase [Limisphaerales bacterium]